MNVYTLVFKELNYLIEKDLLTILNVGKLWKLFSRKTLLRRIFEKNGRRRVSTQAVHHSLIVEPETVLRPWMATWR